MTGARFSTTARIAPRPGPPGRDPAPDLLAGGAVLDAVPLLVELGIMRNRRPPVAACRDTGSRPRVVRGITEPVGIAAPVGQQPFRWAAGARRGEGALHIAHPDPATGKTSAAAPARRRPSATSSSAHLSSGRSPAGESPFRKARRRAPTAARTPREHGHPRPAHEPVVERLGRTMDGRGVLPR